MNNTPNKSVRKYVPKMDVVVNENFTYNEYVERKHVMSLDEFVGNTNIGPIHEALRSLDTDKATCGKFKELLAAVREKAPTGDEDIMDDIDALNKFSQKYCSGDDREPATSVRKIKQLNNLAEELGIISAKRGKKSSDDEPEVQEQPMKDEPSDSLITKGKSRKLGGKRGSEEEFFGPSKVSHEILSSMIRDEITQADEKPEIHKTIQGSDKAGEAIVEIKAEIVRTLQSARKDGVLRHSPFANTPATKKAKSVDTPKFGVTRKPNIQYEESGEVKGVHFEEMNIGFQPRSGIPMRVVIYSNSIEDYDFNIGTVVTNDPVDLYKYSAAGKLTNPKFSNWKTEMTLVEKFSANPDDIIKLDKIEKMKDGVYQQYLKSLKGKTPRDKDAMHINYVDTQTNIIKTAYEKYIQQLGASSSKMGPDIKHKQATEFINNYIEELKVAITNYDFDDDLATDYGIAHEHMSPIQRKYKKAGAELNDKKKPYITDKIAEKIGRNAGEDAMLISTYEILRLLEVDVIKSHTKHGHDKEVLIENVEESFRESEDLVITGPIILIFDIIVSMKNEEFSNLKAVTIKNQREIDKLTAFLNSDESLDPQTESMIRDKIKSLEHEKALAEKQIASGKPVTNVSDIDGYLNPAPVDEETQKSHIPPRPTFWVQREIPNKDGKKVLVDVPMDVKEWLKEKEESGYSTKPEHRGGRSKKVEATHEFTREDLTNMELDELMEIVKTFPELEEKIETSELNPKEIVDEILKYQEEELQKSDTGPSQEEMEKEAQKEAQKGDVPELDDDTSVPTEKKKRVLSEISLKADPGRFKPVKKDGDDKKSDEQKDDKKPDEKKDDTKSEKKDKKKDGFKGYNYIDKDGNKAHTWDYEESIGE